MDDSTKVRSALHEGVQAVREKVEDLDLDEGTTRAFAESLEPTCSRHVAAEPIPAHFEGREAFAHLDAELEQHAAL